MPAGPEGEFGPEGPMGPEGEMGPGGPMGPGGGAEAAPAPQGETGPPLEPNRTNPFSRPGVEADEEAFEDVDIRRIGPDWSSVPITKRMGFLPPTVPEPEAPPTPPEAFEVPKPLKVTSIMWTKEGQAMAVYEYGTAPDAQSGVVRPGERLDLDEKSLQIMEIQQDHIIVKDRDTGREKTIYLSEKAPEPERPQRQQRRPNRRGQQPRGGGGQLGP